MTQAVAEPKTSLRAALIGIFGLLLVLSGIFFNEKVLAAFFSVDGKISLWQVRLLIIIFELVLIGAGTQLLIHRHKIGYNELFLLALGFLIPITGFMIYDLTQAYSKVSQPHSGEWMSGTHIQDGKLGWSLQPGSRGRHVIEGVYDVTYDIDEKGRRVVPHGKTPADFHLYFFGDSFTFGTGVNNAEAYPNIISSQYVNDRVRVLNMGVMGYGFPQMYQRFLNMKDDIKQGDLVVFTPIAEDLARNLKDFEYPASYLFFKLIPVDQFPDYRKGKLEYEKLDTWRNRFYFLALSAPYTGFIFRRIHAYFCPDPTVEGREIISRIRQEVESRGARFALFFIPDASVCESQKYAYDLSRFNYFDIKSYFPENLDEIESLKLPADGHWNAKGNAVVAKAIAETLIQHKIIDRKYLRPEAPCC